MLEVEVAVTIDRAARHAPFLKARRMLLSDTLVERFNTEEIKGIIGHELGHLKNRDLPLQFCLSSVGTGFILFATHHILETASRGWGLFASAGAQTIALVFVIQLLSLVFGPIYNAISRAIERRADSFALGVTGSGKTYASALEKLAELNLADPSPSRLTEWLFYDHPPIHKRIRHALQGTAI